MSLLWHHDLYCAFDDDEELSAEIPILEQSLSLVTHFEIHVFAHESVVFFGHL